MDNFYLTEKQLKEAELLGTVRAALKMDAVIREHYEAVKKIPCHEMQKPLPDSRIWPTVNELENGLVFDMFADHALLYYTVGLADEVRCVGRFLSSGLGMPSEGFGK